MANLVFDRVLVTGGTGFIGGYVIERLIRSGIRPLITTRSVSAHGAGSSDLYEVDLTKFERTDDLIRSYRPQAVIHLAGISGSNDPTGELSEAINFTATKNLFTSLESAGVDRIVTIGSAAEYGRQPLPFSESAEIRPVSPYGISKANATRAAMQLNARNGFPVTVLRVFSAYGHGQPFRMFLPQLIVHGLANRTFRMSGGQQRRDFVHVTDVADAIVSALCTPAAIGKIINIGSGKGSALRDVAKMVWEACNADPDRLLIGQRPTAYDDDIDTEADISLAKEVLGWQPRVPFVGSDNKMNGLADMIAQMSGEAESEFAADILKS
jgi:nucleoside-diphosphate-sugar epimerase